MSSDKERRYVVLPGLIVKQNGDQVYLANSAAGTGLECSSGVLAALSLLREPTSLEAIARSSNLTLEATKAIVAPLLDALLVVPADAAAALVIGPTRAPARPIGEFLPIDQTARGAPGAFVIVGAPSGAGAGPEGLPSHGPQLVRQAFPDFLAHPTRSSALQQKWGGEPRALGLVQDIDFRRQYRPEDLPNVFDVGDVVHETGEGLDAFGARLGFVVQRIAETGMKPLTIGGDHSVTRFTAGTLLQQGIRFGIIHFDAHHDFYRGLPPKRLSHANPFSHLIGEPGVTVMRQVGLRAAFEQIEKRAVPVHEPKLEYVSALECQTLSAEQVFAGLPRDIPYYLSFDIDVMDPVYAPETGMPELGGLTYYQCLKLVDYAARSFELVGADIVEVGGSDRRLNWAARIAGRMLAQILLGRSPFSRLETYLNELG